MGLYVKSSCHSPSRDHQLDRLFAQTVREVTHLREVRLNYVKGLLGYLSCMAIYLLRGLHPPDGSSTSYVSCPHLETCTPGRYHRPTLRWPCLLPDPVPSTYLSHLTIPSNIILCLSRFNLTEIRLMKPCVVDVSASCLCSWILVRISCSGAVQVVIFHLICSLPPSSIQFNSGL
jgi:hypothetical protein